MDTNLLNDCEKFHRRDFMRVGMLSFLGLSLSQYYSLADQAKQNSPTGRTNGTADSVILIWMQPVARAIWIRGMLSRMRR